MLNCILIWQCCTPARKLAKYVPQEQIRAVYQNYFNQPNHQAFLKNRLIYVKDVSKRFRGTRREALDTIRAIYCKGQIHALYGSNGSGKSTFLRVLAKQIKPTSGQILHSIERDVRISHFQNLKRSKPFYSLQFGFRINYLLGQAHKSVNDLKFQEEILRVSTSLPNDSVCWAIFHTLTNCGDLLIFDEPFSILSKKEKKLLNEVIMISKACHKSVVVATHSIEWIDEFADDMLVFSRGQSIANGRIDYLRQVRFRQNRQHQHSFTVKARSKQEKFQVLEFLRDRKQDVWINPLS